MMNSMKYISDRVGVYKIEFEGYSLGDDEEGFYSLTHDQMSKEEDDLLKENILDLLERHGLKFEEIYCFDYGFGNYWKSTFEIEGKICRPDGTEIDDWEIEEILDHIDDDDLFEVFQFPPHMRG